MVERLECLVARDGQLEALAGRRVGDGHDELARTSAPEQLDLQSRARAMVELFEEPP